ncbi:ATP-dependent Clp protease proteolytic subunit 4 [Turnera subulata]|uniref:ATP-dependent Clp protease proteolytic subunit n=1 Tax=Turnera subulata TaxID=218843 RepID=A0A9Q0FEU0_9ROSI|nr:ATP-dependent Clp protease proteolytic subunit 4 [Turnera subulata]
MDLLSLSLCSSSSSTIAAAPHKLYPLSRHRLSKPTPPPPLLSTRLSFPWSSPRKDRSFSSSLNANSSSSSSTAVPQLCIPVLSEQQHTAEADMRGAETDIMGMLLRERIVFLGNNIDDFVADAIIGQLVLLDAQDPTKDIRLFINSPGGSLSAALAIYDVLQLVKADVSTIALGTSSSTASLILGGGRKGKRLAMPHTRIMIHQPLGGVSGQVNEVEVQAEELLKNKNNVISIISGFTGRTLEQVEKDIEKDRYMSPLEALEFGLIDEVIDRDSILPLPPLPAKVKSTFFEELRKDPMKFMTPDIPEDEIY